MAGKVFLICCLLGVFAAVSDALAIGFEVDTPLDPFLGGISKIKRHIMRKIKDLSADENFVNAAPLDQLNMLFNQPSTILPPFLFPDQTSQAMMTNQLPLSNLEQRKLGLGQMSLPFIQFGNRQSTFNNLLQNQGMTKRGSSAPGPIEFRHIPGLVQQLTQGFQPTTTQSNAQCPFNLQGQRFF